MLLFSSLATAQWCTGTPDQNIDAARANFKAACGETWNDQKHICEYKQAYGFHCNGNLSASSPTQTPAPTTQQPPVASNTGGGNNNTTSESSQNLTAPSNIKVKQNSGLKAVEISWDKVPGAAGYNIYRDNNYIGTLQEVSRNT